VTFILINTGKHCVLLYPLYLIYLHP